MRIRTMQKDSKIFVAGHKGLVGSAIVRRLKEDGYTNVITKDRSECDLTKSDDVKKLFEDNRIDFVFDAAARVGGIHANDTYSAEFIYQNTMIQTNRFIGHTNTLSRSLSSLVVSASILSMLRLLLRKSLY